MIDLWKNSGRRLAATALAAGSVLVTACSDSGPVEITESRPLATQERELRIVSSDAERFRAGSQTPAGETGQGNPISFSFDLPEGWKQIDRTDFRELNFTFGENDEGECYLTLLPGGGAGVGPNVNRWRAQMALEPLEPDAIAALPQRKLFGREATFISLDGSFTPVGGGGDPRENYRMLGLILASDFGAIFVKMTGPRDLVEANTEAFDAFCSSLKPN